MPALIRVVAGSASASNTVGVNLVIAGNSQRVEVGGVTVSGAEIPGGVQLVGYLWGVVVDALTNEYWFTSTPVLFGNPTVVVFPPELRGNVFRVVFIPASYVGTFDYQFFSGRNS